MQKTGIVILAAGNGSRLGLATPKPLVSFLGKPMIKHLIDNLPNLPYFIIISPKDLTLFETLLGNQSYLFQHTPLGTGHAIASQYEALKDFQNIIILNADTPLVPKSLIESLCSESEDTLIGFESDDTQSYGQIVTKNDLAIQIIEKRDREADLSNLCYSGIMMITKKTLETTTKLSSSPITHEYYLTSIVSPSRPFKVIRHNKEALQGINTFEELLTCEALSKSLTYHKLLTKQASVIDYQSLVFLNTDIGNHCHIEAQVNIQQSQIGHHCHIGQGAILQNVTLKDHVTILPYSVLSHCEINSHSTIGPFAHIQEETAIGKYTHIGNFVEIKRSIIKDRVKAKHLSYLGDAYIDVGANIGAGALTCNYVPWRKEKAMTYVGAYAFVGAHSLLIGPCHIGPYSLCAAGTTIQGTVLPKHIAISRSKMITKYSIRLYQALADNTKS